MKQKKERFSRVLCNKLKPAAGRWKIFFVVGLLLFWGASGFGQTQPEIKPETAEIQNPQTLPFAVGEQISYRVSWEMIPAGNVTFKVMDVVDFQGQTSWHFVAEGKSKRFIDFFYKIRDRFDSYTDLDFSHSLLYKKLQTGKEDKNVVVYFDWDKKTATYSNHGGKRDPIEIPEKTFDPLASFYKLRTLNLSGADVQKQDLFFPVTDGKKCFIQKGEIIKKERISLSSKTYDTYVVIPHVNHFSGVFKKSENPTVKVWLSADARQIPVRITIKVFIGSVIFELINDSRPLSF